MKRLLLILCLGIAFNSLAQNIPNRGFENWETDLVFELPEYWATSNEREGRLNVSKTTDAHTGQYALHIRNKEDSSFGYFMMGHVGENGPDGGFPYGSTFDSVTGWYKCDMMPGDTALVITLKFGPSDTTMVMSPIWGTANTWTRFAFEVPSHPSTDVFFGIVGTNPFVQGNYFPESWIIVDDVAFTYSSGATPDTLENASFERWEDVHSQEPFGWNSLNFMSEAIGEDPSVTPTDEAHSGALAVKVTTVELENRGKVGWLYNGLPPGQGGFQGGFAYDAIPTSLSGYYKYLPNGTDTAIVGIMGSYYDEAKDSTAHVFFFHTFLTAANTYTPFEILLPYDTTRPLNQINIIAGSSIKLFDFPDQALVGTALYLDDLWLESKCAFADTTELFAFTDTMISYNRTETPMFAMDSGYRSYLWSTGDTTYTIEITDDPLVVSVTVTDSNGCVISDSLTFTLDFRASVLELSRTLPFYPNPARSVIFIEAKDNATLQVFDMRGAELMKQTLVAGRNTVDIRALPAGEFILIMEAQGVITYGLMLKE